MEEVEEKECSLMSEEVKNEETELHEENQKLKVEVAKANRVIEKLQKQIGNLNGVIALRDTDNETYLTYIKQLQNSEE